MEEELKACLKDFNLEQALIVTDKMHDIDKERELTYEESKLWEMLTIKIERERNNPYFK